MSVIDTAPGGANLHLLRGAGDELENRYAADIWHASDWAWRQPGDGRR